MRNLRKFKPRYNILSFVRKVTLAMLKKKETIKMRKVLPNSYFSNIDLPGEAWHKLTYWQGNQLKHPYWVSNKGRIKNRDLQLLGGQEDAGYHYIQLTFQDKDRPVAIHKLVLTIFNGPPPEGMIDPTVNHIDHNILNNSIENLEWMSRSDNSRDGSLRGDPHRMRIRVKTHDSIVLEFDHQGLADDYLGSLRGYISRCMHNHLPILDAMNNEVILSFSRGLNLEWQAYVPTRLPRIRRLLCIVTDTTGEHKFWNLSDASRYLNQDPTYIRNRHDCHRTTAVNRVTGEQVTFVVIYPTYITKIS